MIAHVYLEGYFFPKKCKNNSDTTRNEELNVSRKSLSLWHAQRFNNIRHENIISYNLRTRLVGNIAKDYENYGVELSKLIKEGSPGFTHALNNFGYFEF